MSGAVRTASILPALQRAAATSTSRAAARPRDISAASKVPAFPLETLRVLPMAQPMSALDAEEQTEVQPSLEVGPVDDAYEREADRIAGTVMQEPAAVAPSADAPIVRRVCAACAADEREDRVQPRRVQRAAAAGAATLAASPGQLTTGGAPLRPEVRGFYEERLGRDLSAVRVHASSSAVDMNDSIAAHAFTYGSHIWLGASERAEPGFTLSHEIAHVLQQTQPAGLSAGAANPQVSARRVRRRAMWAPKDGRFTRSPGASHDAVVTEVSKTNSKDMVCELPIPNGALGRLTAGFADFAKLTPANALPGMQIDKLTKLKAAVTKPAAGSKTPPPPPASPPAGQPPATQPPPSPEPVKDFNQTDWIVGKTTGAGFQKQPIVAGQPMKPADIDLEPHTDTSGNIVGIDKAAKTIAIGELKPGHNAGSRALAPRQIGRYQTALSNVVAAVNARAPTGQHWTLNQSTIDAGGITVPDGLKRRSTKPLFPENLQLKLDSRPFTSDTPIPGHLVFGPDPKGAGAWTYLWVPDRVSEAKGLTAGERPRFQRLATELTALIKELTQRPAQVKTTASAPAVKKRPRRAASSRPCVRRQAKPEARKDPFNLREWEAKRQKLHTNYADWEKADPKGVESLRQAKALREANEQIADELKDFQAEPLPAEVTEDVKEFDRLNLLTGTFGRVLGVARDTFGKIFVALASVYDKFRARWDERMKKAPTEPAAGAFSGWKERALKLLIKGAVTAVKLISQQVIADFAACLDGMAARLLDELIGKAEEALQPEIQALTDAFDEVKSRIDSELEPWLADIDELFRILQEVKQLDDFVSKIESAARIGIEAASCLTPPLEGCLEGLIAQLAIDDVLDFAAGTDWFRKAVINPLALKIVAPIGDAAYLKLKDLLLGDPKADTLRGRISKFAADTPSCTPPDRNKLFSEADIQDQLPTIDPAAPTPEARQLAEQYASRNRDQIRKRIREALVDSDGEPATDEQVQRLQDDVKNSGYPREVLKRILDSARKGNKVDVEAVLQFMEAKGGRPGRQGGSGSPPAGGQGGGGSPATRQQGGSGPGTPPPPPPPLSIHKRYQPDEPPPREGGIVILRF
jgi:hypothetical protein